MKDIKTIMVIGTGVIGASWTALFLAQGYQVIAYDIEASAEYKLKEYIVDAWPILVKIHGIDGEAPLDKLQFTTSLEKSVGLADLVQENGPENLAFKQKLYHQLDQMLDEDVIIISSSSGLKMSDIQIACERFPQRCVVGHPFNPPHLIPLVEIVGGKLTSDETVNAVSNFYRSLGKETVTLCREIAGHVANRLQSALWREIIYLVSENVITLNDADKAVTWGPGLRWGVMGPSLLFHLGGGNKGMQGYLDKFADSHVAWWNTLGQPKLDDNVKNMLITQMDSEVAGHTQAELEARRDTLLSSLIALKKERQ
ncbi:3-hydroxyacyl-CoA dehydrogenase NAD-binding domain-containing protein (plasmid) [Pantoea sp. C3]|uniref:3-hydroxyacyl-CoA dehydrogenase NAD-binding domain-containing protein n=1 Tax=Pantoea phytostimulans TaxID=2769024 RepID=UPI0038F6B955